MVFNARSDSVLLPFHSSGAHWNRHGCSAPGAVSPPQALDHRRSAAANEVRPFAVVEELLIQTRRADLAVGDQLEQLNEDGMHREEIHDSSVAPEPALQRHRLEEQRKRDRHPDRVGHGEIRVCPRPEILQPVRLDVPDRRVRRRLQLT